MTRSMSADPLPFYVRRHILPYQRYLRDAITQVVQKKYEELHAQHKAITVEEISECVGEVVFGSGRNWRMEQLCLDAVDKGQSRPLKDVIDELRTSIAGSTTA